MQAFVQSTYGPPETLELREVARPSPGAGQVLVRVSAASVNAFDWHFLLGQPYLARLLGRSSGMGIRRPLIPTRGWDVSGTVEEVGEGVSRLQVGDEVFGWAHGSFADYVAVRETNFALKGSELSFEQAAAIPMAGMTALQAIRDLGGIQPGHKVLINGASGGVGTFAVQLARSLGGEVTAVCSTANVEAARSNGAQHVIDYTRDDFTRSDNRYDLIIDSAVSRSMAETRRVLAPDGTSVTLGDSGGHWVGGFRRMLLTVVVSAFAKHRLRTCSMKPRLEDLEFLRDLVETGEISPVIEQTFSFEDAPAALAYVLDGHARAKVVVRGRTE